VFVAVRRAETPEPEIRILAIFASLRFTISDFRFPGSARDPRAVVWCHVSGVANLFTTDFPAVRSRRDRQLSATPHPLPGQDVLGWLARGFGQTWGSPIRPGIRERKPPLSFFSHHPLIADPFIREGVGTTAVSPGR
jgi:hypothetical protein